MPKIVVIILIAFVTLSSVFASDYVFIPNVAVSIGTVNYKVSGTSDRDGKFKGRTTGTNLGLTGIYFVKDIWFIGGNVSYNSHNIKYRDSDNRNHIDLNEEEDSFQLGPVFGFDGHFLLTWFYLDYLKGNSSLTAEKESSFEGLLLGVSFLWRFAEHFGLMVNTEVIHSYFNETLNEDRTNNLTVKCGMAFPF